MIEITKANQLIISISERLDATNFESAQTQINEEIELIDTDVLLDVSKLEYLSSAGLQVILQIAKDAKAAGKTVYLKGAKEGVWEIFKLSGFLTFLKEI